MIQALIGIYVLIILIIILCLIVGIQADENGNTKLAIFCGNTLIISIVVGVIYVIHAIGFGLIYLIYNFFKQLI